MTEQKKEVPGERQLGEDKNQNPEHYQGDPMNTTLPAPLEFRPEIDVDSTTAGLVTISAEHVPWLGRHIVALIGHDARLNLEPAEAREIADALYAVAALLDGHHTAADDEATELHRRTEPGNPSFEETI